LNDNPEAATARAVARDSEDVTTGPQSYSLSESNSLSESTE
jgi:hypothetical protein